MENKMAEYISNKKFYTEYCTWKEECSQAISEGRGAPVASRYLGDCLIQICTNLAYRGNFVGYSFRSEMIGDAIEACLRSLEKFDEKKYTNPFSYFTQIAFNAMIRRIKKEKRQHNIKIELIKDNIYEGISRGEFDDEEYQSQMKAIIMQTVDSNSLNDKMRDLSMIDVSDIDLNDLKVDLDEEEFDPEMDIYGDE